MTDCKACGNLGYTVEHNSQGVEYFAGCNCEVLNCPEAIGRGHEYETGAHRCTHCGALHPSLRREA
jgi:hypothetical protein